MICRNGATPSSETETRSGQNSDDGGFARHHATQVIVSRNDARNASISLARPASRATTSCGMHEPALHPARSRPAFPFGSSAQRLRRHAGRTRRHGPTCSQRTTRRVSRLPRRNRRGSWSDHSHVRRWRAADGIGERSRSSQKRCQEEDQRGVSADTQTVIMRHPDFATTKKFDSARRPISSRRIHREAPRATHKTKLRGNVVGGKSSSADGRGS